LISAYTLLRLDYHPNMILTHALIYDQLLLDLHNQLFSYYHSQSKVNVDVPSLFRSVVWAIHTFFQKKKLIEVKNYKSVLSSKTFKPFPSHQNYLHTLSSLKMQARFIHGLSFIFPYVFCRIKTKFFIRASFLAFWFHFNL
jgi:hypothetical protein